MQARLRHNAINSSRKNCIQQKMFSVHGQSPLAEAFLYTSLKSLGSRQPLTNGLTLVCHGLLYDLWLQVVGREKHRGDVMASGVFVSIEHCLWCSESKQNALRKLERPKHSSGVSKYNGRIHWPMGCSSTYPRRQSSIGVAIAARTGLKYPFAQ